ncbi:acyl-CoA dehydratase activase-related protein [Acetanaerobacterium elongatum]|uniref:CoA-substrate-specific enzyme activase, putative n=1 Tax=Acetanaerobacterium elongatum TaxID=258515 RepID=A0A1H0D1C0_9FIRM|nr:acyl-CoA dehydratase activase-related protein [Acetanaerobacterium elongatum]SDN63918.1 CoA-substrate-specific enzyme activase, putative [Acetanaerobacterium elongatum]
MRIGLDIGSTTIKSVVVDDNKTVIFRSYERHFSQITQKTAELLQTIGDIIPTHHSTEITISGSAGMGLAESCGIPFVQEVYATRIAANRLAPGTDVVIELGGEDAKILFLSGGMEVRMNGSCAGGTGAFIDQMATLLNVPLEEMDDLAKQHEKLYTIASRCGVFAKSDIQPLLNQGAKKSDIAASIFGAVVNQTIAGLAQGRPIIGKILYLGGPLTFLSQLRKSFDETLHTTGVCPEDSLYYVALGAAYASDTTVDLEKAIEKLNNYHASEHYATITPLFENKEEYERFAQRHAKHNVPQIDPAGYEGKAYLGLDAGSTTVKAVILGKEGQLLASSYQPNNGNPVPIIRAFLLDFYEKYPQIQLAGATVTGYGEEIVKNAFRADSGVVETVAHFTAAKSFMPDVEFIIDIGGQDIKCFKIRNGVIDNIFLNEACSSGCGSFLQTFANALGYSIEEFAKLGLFADHPVDLGSRCTVFMNSSVKQAQKDGASIENISAGLSISVVKNALYKVIRAASADELGKHIVVQGGTFLNDAVLRAFEQELKTDAVRPGIAGLMGAYGAALYAKKHSKGCSTILNKQELLDFTHEVSNVNCGLCSNNCQLTINRFDGGRRYISGNRCERPITKKATDNSLNIYDYKLKLLKEFTPGEAKRGIIGIPMELNMYELLPFWHTFFTTLGFKVITSPDSSRELYLNGQSTIPSDTVCFPAKLMHGHVQQLIDDGITTIFYPCLTYNIDEGLGDNHYNCPVVAYYPEVITSNMPAVKKLTFIKDYVGIHRPKDFPGKMQKILAQYFDGISLKEVEAASKSAYKAYGDYFKCVRAQGARIIAQAEKENRPIIVLAGRPYHVDPEINHGIDRLIAGFGVAIVSEDCVSYEVKKFTTTVLNQWTYHSRLYAAAKYIANKPNMNLVQLVSFGCGVDAITTDEVREILEQEGRIYTQIKIDEITNLGAVKIRLRSLFAATQEQ